MHHLQLLVVSGQTHLQSLQLVEHALALPFFENACVRFVFPQVERRHLVDLLPGQLFQSLTVVLIMNDGAGGGCLVGACGPLGVSGVALSHAVG